jgi:hypothetical protein
MTSTPPASQIEAQNCFHRCFHPPLACVPTPYVPSGLCLYLPSFFPPPLLEELLCPGLQYLYSKSHGTQTGLP